MKIILYEYYNLLKFFKCFTLRKKVKLVNLLLSNCTLGGGKLFPKYKSPSAKGQRAGNVLAPPSGFESLFIKTPAEQ